MNIDQPEPTIDEIDNKSKENDDWLNFKDILPNITSEKLGITLDDFFRVLTMLIIIALLNGNSFTDKNWIAQLIGTIIVYVLFDLYLSDHSLIKQHRYGNVIGTILKIGGMLMLVNYFQDRPYDKWFGTTLFGTLGAFIIYDFVIINVADLFMSPIKEKIDNNDILTELKWYFGDVIRVAIIMFMVRLLTGGNIDYQWLITTGFALIGLSVYNIVIKKHITHRVANHLSETFLDGN
jgi:hypothetical protein